MKTKIKLFGVLLLVCVLGCKEYDDTELWNEVNNLADRIASLERMCSETNTNIGSLQKTLKALEQNDYITNVAPINEGEDIIGYTITFAKNGTVTIYNGRDGKDGDTPAIGVKKDSDGIYYWTVGNNWLTDGKNNKIKAEAQDGKNGTNPKFKIQDGFWYVSYDEGGKWEKLGKATGENGQDGKDGTSITIKEDDLYVYMTFPNSTTLALPKSLDSTQNIKLSLMKCNIYEKYAIMTAKVEGVEPNIEVGMVYGEIESLPENNSKIATQTATSQIFSILIKDLEKGKTYYYKIFAVVDGKYYWSETNSFVFEKEEAGLALGMKKDDVLNALPQSGVVTEGDVIYYNDSEKKRTLSFQFKDNVLAEMALVTALANISVEEVEELLKGASFMGYLKPKVSIYVNEEKKEVIKIEETVKNGYDYLLMGFTNC